MKMIQSGALLGVWLSVAVAGFAATAQSQPPAQQTQAPPVASPAIITLPQATVTPIAPPGAPADGASVKSGDRPPAQTPTKDSKAPAGQSAANQVDSSGAPPKDPTAIGPAYVIGPEDYLYIRVWKAPEFSGTVSVGPDGMISMQLINEVRASGLTARQLGDVLTERLHEFLTTPDVNVQVIAARSRTYIILGDGVARPGIYPLPKPLTVLEALIAGGTFSPFAKKTKIYVLRAGKKYPFNWNEVSKGKNLKQNIYIQNGDQIYVP